MALTTCKVCGKEISDRAIVCPACGTALVKEQVEETKPITCEDCGKEVPAGAAICPNCGCPIQFDEEQIGKPNAEQKTEAINIPKISKKTKKTIIITAIVVALLIGGSIIGITMLATPETAATVEHTQEPTIAPTAAPVDGYGDLGGVWKVGGIYYVNRLIKISDYPEIASIYEAEYLIFNEDGTFLYTNLFYSTGTYSRLSGNSFMLSTDRVYMMDYVDGQAVEKETESSPKTSWIVTIVNGEMSGLRFAALDPITWKEKVNADPIIFVKASD